MLALLKEDLDRQNVFNGDSTPVGQREPAKGLEQNLDRVTFVDGHEPIADPVGRCVEAHGQVDRDTFLPAQPLDSWNESYR